MPCPPRSALSRRSRAAAPEAGVGGVWGAVAPREAAGAAPQQSSRLCSLAGALGDVYPGVGLAALVRGGRDGLPRVGCPQPGRRRGEAGGPGCHHLVVWATVLLIFASFAFSVGKEVGDEFLLCLCVVNESCISCLTPDLVTLERNGGRDPPPRLLPMNAHLSLQAGEGEI